MITEFKIYESATDYSKFIDQTPIVNNGDGDTIWIYRKMFYYYNRFHQSEFNLCTFSEMAYDDSGYNSPETWYITRGEEKIYYDIKILEEFLRWLAYDSYLGKNKTEVENKIDEFYISIETDKYNL